MNRPYVHINVAMTADGKIDTIERRGAVISSPSDEERVDRLRAEADAVLVGGRTLRNEDPKLTIRSRHLRAQRVSRGLPPNPTKVGVVTVADIKDDARFLVSGPARVVIFTTDRTSKQQLDALRSRGAELYVHHGVRADLELMLHTLKETGVNRLMVEGGGTINFELLHSRLVDEITAYVAPRLFGGAGAPTLADGLGLGPGAAIQLKLLEAEKWDDGGVFLRYSLNQEET